MNPQRQGVDGMEGSYMLDTGSLIQQLRQRQSDPIFFLVSNSCIQNQKSKSFEDSDRRRIEKEFGISWSLDFDAADVSPCRRRSTFFTNIPYEFTEIEKGYNLSMSDCLEDGFLSPARLMENRLVDKGSLEDEDRIVDKSRNFTISLSTLDDDRMQVYKKLVITTEKGQGKSKYVRRAIRVSEREKMMGFPPNYISPPGRLISD
jgi:hypothetical protein